MSNAKGSWETGQVSTNLSCRCGAEDHVEAVKKLQNSTKLLQKVIDSMEGGVGLGSAWNGLPRLSPSA